MLDDDYDDAVGDGDHDDDDGGNAKDEGRRKPVEERDIPQCWRQSIEVATC